MRLKRKQPLRDNRSRRMYSIFPGKIQILIFNNEKKGEEYAQKTEMHQGATNWKY